MGRLPFIDFVRAVASTLIVWHHLAFYGPLSDVVAEVAPGPIGWLAEYARWAVQAFLVLGGFMTARALAPGGVSRLERVSGVLVKRWRRTVVPYLVVVVLAVVANAVAARFMVHDSVGAPPTWSQLLAHVFLVHDLAGFEAVSAGVWYVAIDFQLFVLCLALVAWTPARGLPFVVAALALVSVVVLNRDSAHDVWAGYFFASYAAGLLAEWSRAGRMQASAFALVVGALVVAGVWDGRPRLLVAAATGLVLAQGARTGWLARWPAFPPIAWLGRTSYSLFLVHFPVCLVVNALVIDTARGRPGVAFAGMTLAWAASLAAAAVFFRYVETPAASGPVARRP